MTRNRRGIRHRRDRWVVLHYLVETCCILHPSERKNLGHCPHDTMSQTANNMWSKLGNRRWISGSHPYMTELVDGHHSRVLQKGDTVQANHLRMCRAPDMGYGCLHRRILSHPSSVAHTTDCRRQGIQYQQDGTYLTSDYHPCNHSVPRT